MIPPEVILEAYRMGVFPMAMEEGEIGWFSPDPRAVIPLDGGFHIPHGLKKVLKKAPFQIQIDTQFEEVMRGCAERSETWISEDIVQTYTHLHHLGFGHSIEAWQDDELVGGLYGLAIGGAFFGESMFSRVSEASKVCLVSLVEHLRKQGFVLLDTQWSTQHLARFGCQEVPREDYMERLLDAVDLEIDFLD